jgi:hypothetical protein
MAVIVFRRNTVESDQLKATQPLRHADSVGIPLRPIAANERPVGSNRRAVFIFHKQSRSFPMLHRLENVKAFESEPPRMSVEDMLAAYCELSFAEQITFGREIGVNRVWLPRKRNYRK